MTDASRFDPAVAAAWGLSGQPRRGPKPKLSLEDIVAAGIEIADEEGLVAVSMARVAASLGYTTMSLYRHVGSKDELLAHMEDAAAGTPDTTLTEGADWRTGLETWALHALSQQMLHPWQVEIPIGGPPLMPRSIAWMDWALTFLNPLPLSPLERLSALMLVSGYVRNEVSMRMSLARGRAVRTEAEATRSGTVDTGTPAEAPDGEADGATDALTEDRAYASALRELTDAKRFPGVTALLDAGLFDAETDADVDDGDDFMLRFGLDRILDGIEKLVTERSAQQ